jgi:hypothetical protein
MVLPEVGRDGDLVFILAGGAECLADCGEAESGGCAEVAVPVQRMFRVLAAAAAASPGTQVAEVPRPAGG